MIFGSFLALPSPTFFQLPGILDSYLIERIRYPSNVVSRYRKRVRGIWSCCGKVRFSYKNAPRTKGSLTVHALLL